MSGSALRLPESMQAVELYLDCRDWNEVRTHIIKDNLFQMNTKSSLERITGELLKRLRMLTDDELEFLGRSFGVDRQAMLWVAICRTYQFVRDLSEQVLAARYNRTIPDFTYGAYDAFFDEQSEIHPELEAMTEEGRHRMRNQIFQMMGECGLITEDGTITPIYPSQAFKSALGEGRRQDLLVFPGRLA